MPARPRHQRFRVTPVKVVSEAVREHEASKYYPFLESTFPLHAAGSPVDGAQVTTSTESLLTALLQLGLHRTKTERGFISLFDTDKQYIIAEATPTTCLVPGLPSDQCDFPLLLCGHAIPRSHSPCEHALYPTDDELSSHTNVAVELPCIVIPQLSSDDRFSSKPFCQGGTMPQFFAAVPIRTRKGVNIGVISVRSFRPDVAWDESCAAAMREISHAAFEHLDTSRAKDTFRRNERVSRGLGSFIEGEATLSGWKYGPNEAAYRNSRTTEGRLDKTQQMLQNDPDELTLETTDSPRGRSPSNVFAQPRVSFEKGGISTSQSSYLSPERGDKTRIFSRAANIIRESFEIEGCLFFDVTVGSYKAPKAASRPQSPKDGSGSSSALSSDEALISAAGELNLACELLGFATSYTSSINAGQMPSADKHISKRFLATLLRQYPKGKIFNFDASGELQSDDTSGDDTDVLSDPLSPVIAEPPLPDKKKKSPLMRHGARIYASFPGVRSVAFVPVWDFKHDRWSVGGFVYTMTPLRMFTVDGELSLLKAFANSATAQVYSLETLQADKAKADVLGSLSHELRSPLHGIILSTELLNDTSMNVFQGSAAHTIEVCCRTLLHTLDHLLDYSKINSFAAQLERGERAPSRSPLNRLNSSDFGKMQLYQNARLDELVEEVSESVFAGFNFQLKSIRQLSRQDMSKEHADDKSQNWMDRTQAKEELMSETGIAQERGFHNFQTNGVSIYIIIDPEVDWQFYMPSGALRRIVMNLLGNALKFTERGFVKVSLSLDQQASKLSAQDRMVRLTVQDTGKGMSDEYLQHRVFRPFSQEDDLMPGTGLGLSIVKKIISTLKGRISIDSKPGSGTVVTVHLPLSTPREPFPLTPSPDVASENFRDIRGLRVRLMGGQSQAGASLERLAAVEGICSDTLGLEVIPQTEGNRPDVVLWLDEALPNSIAQLQQYNQSANIVVCQDALVAYQRVEAYEASDQDGIFEFLSQPIGPRKLARSIQLAVKRWAGLSKLETITPPRRESTSVKSLPLRGSSDTDPESPPELPMKLQAPSADSLPGKERQTILCVDDNSINLKMLLAYMAKLGRPFEACTNGKEALDTYTANPTVYRAILMDISMPVMNGFEASREIRRFEHDEKSPPTKILALSGLGSHEAQQQALESGIDEFLSKPVRLQTLASAMEKLGI